MATVRIYKVAELLDTTSQEVLALLKREHGIELKSASSTLEEVVARSFVERQARQRGITLPKGDMFAESAAPVSKGTAAKKGPVLKKPEPPKPAPQIAAPTTTSGQYVHTIAPGETLMKLSRQYNKSLTQIARANNLAPSTQVKVGDRIVIPGVRGNQPQQFASAAPAPAPAR